MTLISETFSEYNTHIVNNKDHKTIVYYGLLGHRIGDQIATTAVARFWQKLVPDAAIIAMNYSYGNQRWKIDPNVYFNDWDAIINISSDEEDRRFYQLLDDKKAMAIHGYNLWNAMPFLKRDHGIYPHIISSEHYDDWWKQQRQRLEIPQECVVMHILEDATYNVCRNHRRRQMLELAKLISPIMPIIILSSTGKPINDRNIFDFSGAHGYNIDQNIAIINASSIYIGGDTGFTHAAGALGKRVLAIYPSRAVNEVKDLTWDSMVSIPDNRLTKIDIGPRNFFDLWKAYQGFKTLIGM